MNAAAPGHGVLANPDWPGRLLFNWDSSYFFGIARNGYSADSPTLTAFFPGYPLLARTLAAPFGGGDSTIVVMMMAISQVAALVAALLIWQLAAPRGTRVAIAATALILLGPYALFLSASYSEALFLAFAAGAWLAATRHRWFATGLLAAGASFVRINGVFLVIALAVFYLVERRRTGQRLGGIGLIGTAIGFLGVGAYWLYLLVLTGSPTAWSDAQAEGWNRVTQWPWLTFYQTAGRVLFASTLDRRIQYGLDIIFAAVLVFAITWLARNRRWPELAFVGLTALTLMTSFSYLSLARNTATLFPLALALAPAVLERRGARVVVGVIALSVAILLFDTRQFTLGLWAD